jgi:hypothetical protein
MATVFVDMKGATLTFAATLAELATTGLDVSCQISDAHVQPAPETETTGATLCTDAVDRTVGLKATLEIIAFQDWSDPAGFCWFLQTNKLTDQYFELALPESGSHTGKVTLVPLPYGGAAGASLTGTVSMAIEEWTDTPPVPVGMAAEAEPVDTEAATAAA